MRIRLDLARAAAVARRLGWRDRLEVLRIAALAGVVEVWLRVGTLPSLARALGVPLDVGPDPVGTPMLAPLPAWAVRRLGLTRAVLRRSPTGPTCLRTSLVAGQRLRRLHPRLRVGVAREDKRLLAHAWLEVDGQYFDPGAASYQTVQSVGP